jgi:succinate dehydrogenase / fumarate reductase cytochrome b subunit
MTWKQMFTSSIGKKLVMGFTGIFLILFLIVHVGLNACIWANDKGEMFNKAAHFMGSMIIPRILEIGLFAGFFAHIIQGYMLTIENRRKRTIPYAIDYGNKGSKWYSRSMGILGTLILLFLIIHIYHFWTPSRLGGVGNIEKLNTIMYSGTAYHDLYGAMKEVFEVWWIVALYIIACISLAYHLAHGFQSAFKTLGVHNKKYQTLLICVGNSFSIIVPLAFALMPLSFYFGWIK